MIADFEKIPSEMKARPQWIMWREEVRDGKPTKVPYCPQNPTRKAKANDPATWGTFDAALSAAKTNSFMGVGYEFSPQDDYTGVDVDKCRDPGTGGLRFCAGILIEALSSYTEESPSKIGLHTIIKGKLPPLSGHKKKMNCGWEIEVYDSLRYFTMTGHHLEGTPTTIEDRQAELEVLHTEIFGKLQAPPKDTGTGPTLDLSDQELIDKAHRADDGEKFTRLWRGDTTGYDSPSEATAALLSKLVFWCGPDPERIDGLFRQSGLMRKKWNRPQSGSTWGRLEIEKAISRAKEFYTPGRKLPGPESEPKEHQVGGGEGKAQKPEITDAELLNFARAGQVGDARLFIRLLKGKYCYDHAAGHWYQWGGHYWIEDDLKNILMALDQVIDVYERQAQKCAWNRARATREGNEILAKQAAAEETIFLKKIAQLQKKDWRRDVLDFAAAGESSLGISGKEWDSNRLLIACPNGVLDLGNGGFRDGKPEDYIKTACPTEWRGQLEPAPQWDKFLEQIFDGDQELVSYKQRLCGYAISGQRIERVMPICWGVGWNGKGTFFETIEHTWGELAGPVPAEVLLEESKHQHKSGGAPTPEIMRLRGKRLAWASETNEGRRLNAGKVKWLTGGDTLVGRDPFGKKMVAFQPTHTLFLMTNHKPKANPDDPALWGRLHLIPFELSFVDNPTEPHHRKRNKHLADKLKKEAPGILAWFVRGFSEWKKKGLDPPPKVSDATEEYRQDQDTVGQFIAEKCKLATGFEVKSSELFKEYRQWCTDNGFNPVWGNTFGERMKAKFEWKTTMNGVFYYGIGILDQNI